MGRNVPAFPKCPRGSRVPPPRRGERNRVPAREWQRRERETPAGRRRRDGGEGSDSPREGAGACHPTGVSLAPTPPTGVSLLTSRHARREEEGEEEADRAPEDFGAVGLARSAPTHSAARPAPVLKSGPRPLQTRGPCALRRARARVTGAAGRHRSDLGSARLQGATRRERVAHSAGSTLEACEPSAPTPRVT